MAGNFRPSIDDKIVNIVQIRIFSFWSETEEYSRLLCSSSFYHKKGEEGEELNRANFTTARTFIHSNEQ